MMHVGDILKTMEDVQYRGDIMINVGDILSTVAVFSTVGKNIFYYLSTPTVLNTSHATG